MPPPNSPIICRSLIVSSRVGLPEAGRERMIEWAHANFDCFGPMNARTEAAFPVVNEMVEYAFSECVPGKLTSDGWAQGIWDAAAREKSLRRSRR